MNGLAMFRRTFVKGTRRALSAVIQILFAAHCVRLLFAPAESATSIRVAGIILSVVAMGLGWWRPALAIAVFPFFLSLLGGLTQTTLVASGSPLLLVFAGLFLGVTARRTLTATAPDHTSDGPRLVIDLLILLTLCSLAAQVITYRDSPGFWEDFRAGALPAYTNAHYFLTATTLWIQGLVYARLILATPPPVAPARWIHAVFATNGVSIAVFLAIQALTGLPEGWTVAGLQSPFEDISSLGAIAGTLFIFWLGAFDWPCSFPARAARLANLIPPAAGLVFSWSRGAWLAAALFVLITAWVRRLRWLVLACVAGAILTVTIANVLPAPATEHAGNRYWSRLSSLVRFESNTDRGAGRMELYHKAWGMIRERPFTGHGIGSFYLTSVRYAAPGDRRADKPEFAHNIFLQLAAEQGLPAATLFLGFVAWILWRGAQAWRESQRPGGTLQLTTLGLTLALGAYLQSNLTANPLLVYSSHAFFFALIIGALVQLVASRPAPPGHPV
jgi:hypothetical protein